MGTQEATTINIIVFSLTRPCLEPTIYRIRDEHLWRKNYLSFRSTIIHTRFLVGFVLLHLQFYMYVLQIVVCPFVLFLLAIVLSVLLRHTDSDCPFGIFKLFLNVKYNLQQHIMNYSLLALFVCDRCKATCPTISIISPFPCDGSTQNLVFWY